MLLETDVFTKKPCPRTDAKANVKKECLAGCIHFLHLSYVSGIPMVCCVWPKRKEHISSQEEKEAAEKTDQKK